MSSTNVSNPGIFGDSSDKAEVMKDAPTEAVEKAADATAKKPEAQQPDSTPQNDADPSSKASAPLFGDDSSDDDEFNDDTIVGKSAAEGAVVAKAAGSGEEKKPLTMSERLGLEDIDDEAEPKKAAEPEPIQPADIPPRKMELLNLHPTAEATSPTTEQPLLHIVKLPNLVGINSTPYNPSTHNLEEEEDYYRGYVHNMIRWRYKSSDDGEIVRDANGEPIRESNTRLVKWSDGSYTLHVGAEVLEVDNLDSSVPLDVEKGAGLPGFAGINGYLYVSQKARIRVPKISPQSEAKEGQDNKTEEEEEVQPAGTVLECIGPILSRFAPRPSSLASEAHRNLTNAIRQRNVKRARIAEIVTDFDPEKEKAARIKGKDDLAKSQSRGRRSGGGGGGRRKATGYEEEGDYDGVNLSKLKRQTLRRGDSDDEMDDYGEDSESDEDEWSKNKKRKKPTAALARVGTNRDEEEEEDSDSSEEGEVVFGDDDEEDDGVFKKKGGAKKSNILDDDDD